MAGEGDRVSEAAKSAVPDPSQISVLGISVEVPLCLKLV